MNAEQDTMFLSKIYLLKSYRGMGLFGRIIDYASAVSKQMGLKKMYLTVNRENCSAIKSYKRSGFKIVGRVDKPIGQGFEMNDYIMEITLE